MTKIRFELALSKLAVYFDPKVVIVNWLTGNRSHIRQN